VEYSTSKSSKGLAGNFHLKFITLLASLIGLGAAILAWMIYHFIGFLYNLFFYQQLGLSFIEPPTSGLPWWIFAVPALGGLICGLMAKYGTKKIIGHGIPEAMEAVWSNKSKVKLRVLILKPISAAIAIGTGAPFGVEGPIIQGGGAMGSVFGQWVSTTAAERKVLLACGAAAGMAATFNTPLAAILVAIELLVFEYKARSFIPISIASLLATGIRRILIGTGAMFQMEPVSFDFFSNLPFLIILGIIIGFAAIAFNKGYFDAEELLHRLPVNDVLLPAIGGLILGIMGLIVPRTFGVGYSVIEEILNNQLTWWLVLLVMIFKVGGVYITLGTKTSGGFLAPVFIAGAAIGSVYATGINTIIPGVSVPVSLFALAGLGTLFGVVSNATFGFTLFAIEVTGKFDALVPVFLVAIIADIVTTLYMKSDIMTTELASRGVDITQDFDVSMLKRFRGQEVMNKNSAVVRPHLTILKLAALIAKEKEEFEHFSGEQSDKIRKHSEKLNDMDLESIPNIKGKSIHDAFPIVNDENKLVGIITYGDIVRALAVGKENSTVSEIGTMELVTGYPDEKLFDLVVRMARHNIEQLPIVTRGNEKKLLGLLYSQKLITTSLRQVEEEYEREEGQLSHYVNMLPSRRKEV